MRRQLRLAAVLLATAACSDLGPSAPDLPSTSHSIAPPGIAGEAVTVLSRNLYFGADLDELFAPGADFGQVAAQLWQTIQYTNFPARAKALALEIQSLRPHLIGLQEVVTYTLVAPDFTPIGQLNHLQLLLSELTALGLAYDIAVLTAHTSAFVPVGSVANPAFYVGFLDADAILVRRDVPRENPAAGVYSARVPLPFGVDILHAWQTVDASVAGQTIRFANTHLETQNFPAVQEAQTAELIQALSTSPWPVVLVGDFNSAANRSAPENKKTATYEMLLSAGFVDLWTRAGPSDKGLTCCHDADLSNSEAGFDQRLDLVLARNKANGRGFAGGVALTVTGDDPSDRFATGLGYSLWASDHAGIAASIWMPKGLTGN